MNTIQKNKINEVIDDITVVIVMYQETKEIIFKTLEKIKDFKIIIVDNNNDKILKQKIMSQFQIENYLLNKKNKGFSFAANQAIKLSKTTYTMQLNPDCIIEKENILLLKQRFKIYKDATIIAPRSIDTNHKTTFSSGVLPERGHRAGALEISGDTCVECIIGACILFKTDFFKKKIYILMKIFFIFFR